MKSTENHEDRPAVAVLGLGNTVLSDDSVGLHVASEVERLLKEKPIDGVFVLTSTRAGFELIDLLCGFTHALIIDSLETAHPAPGLVRKLDVREISGSARLVGVHDIGIGDAFELAATIGVSMPETVEIYAVEGEDTSTISEEMTPAVAAAVAPLAQLLLERASEWCGDVVDSARRGIT